MSQLCRECGAILPDGARTCLQCGTLVNSTARFSEGSQASLDFIQPAIAGGLLLGLLSSLPIISLANLIFGAWILAGGALTAHLVSKQRPSGISYGDGAYGDVLSGCFGAEPPANAILAPASQAQHRLADSTDALDSILGRRPVSPPRTEVTAVPIKRNGHAGLKRNANFALCGSRGFPNQNRETQYIGSQASKSL